MDLDMIVKALRQDGEGYKGYTGKGDIASVKAFVADNGIELNDESGKAIDLDTFAKKKVTISVKADAGEEIAVDQSGDGTENDSEADSEFDAGNGDSQTGGTGGGPEEGASRSRTRTAVKRAVAQNSKVFDLGNYSSDKKAYDFKAKKGGTVLPDADVAELCGAWFRNRMLGGTRDGYAQQKQDERIIQKAGLVSASNPTVPAVVAPFIYEVVTGYSGALRAVGNNLVKMTGSTVNLSALTAEAVVSYQSSENSAAATNASTPTLAQKQLVADTVMGTLAISNQLLNDSAVNIADFCVRSFGRALAKAIDDAYILGDGSTYGASYGLSNATYGVQAGGIYNDNTGWASIAATDLDSVMAKLGNGYRLDECGWLVHRNYFVQVMYPLMRASGGTSLTEAIRGGKDLFGPGADAMYGGYPVWFSDSMPSTTALASKCAYFGVFGKGLALGQVVGAYEVASNEHVGFLTNTTYMRAVDRFGTKAINLGDASTGGGVVCHKTAILTA